MKKPYYNKTFILIFLFVSFFKTSWSQTTIFFQGFDGASNWSYIATHTNGASSIVDTESYNTPYSLLLENFWDDNSAITFSTIDISSYTNVQFSIAYKSIGEADEDDDLYIDYYYFDAGAWTFVSTKIADGNTAPNTVPFGTTGNTGEANPFVASIPDSATSFYAVVRGTYDNDNGGDHDRYYIDDVILTATPPAYPIPQNDDLSIVTNSTAGLSNQINVGNNDNIGTDGGDGEEYSILTTATNGTVTEISDGVFEYIPDTDFIGNDSFTYNICDANNDCAVGTVNISVTFGQCIPTNSSNGTHYITNVTVIGETTLNNTSGDNGGYQDFSTTVAALELYKDTLYDASITVNGNNMGWAIYIDYNQNGDFTDIGESVANTNGEGTGNLSFSIPASALTGKTIMRIGSRRYWHSSVPCGNTGSQPEEFEDYIIDIALTPFQEISLSGNSIDIVNNSTTTSITDNTNFGSKDIYNASSSLKTFVITNNGMLDLSLTGTPIVSFNTPTTDFTVTQQPTVTTLTTGESTTFTINFTPSTIGIKQATVIISNDDPNEAPYTFLIEGEGLQTFPDTDSDGVPDNIDEDDDNDGLLDSEEDSNCFIYPTASTTRSIFLNEDFGTGTNRIPINGNLTDASSTYYYEDGSSLSNLDDGEYTVYYNSGSDIADFSTSYWYQGEDHTPGDTNGRMAIFNADHNPGIFYEALIVGVTANVDIVYGFAAINLDRSDAPNISTRERPDVLMEILDPDGNVISSTSSGLIEPTDASNISGDWVQIETTFNTPYTQFTVRLSNAQPGGLGNDLAIDDITIYQLLCDLDGDGIADTIDLDNDNDGIPNVVELGLGSQDTDKDATVFGVDWLDVNFNGVHDAYESGIAKIDSDNDGVPDYSDLDSDNDGIFDALEYDGFGDIDVSGNGIGNGTDISTGIDDDTNDGDGLLAIIDNNDTDSDSSDHGTDGYPDPLDTDGDTIPDYLDTHNDATGIDDIDTTLYAYLDADNDGIIDVNTDVDLDGIPDSFDTNTSVFGSPRDLNSAYSLFFDGRNDYIEDTNVLVSGDATIMAFVKSNGANTLTTNRVVIGQTNYYIRVNTDNTVSVLLNGNTIITSASAIPNNIWVNLAATTTSGETILYINGEAIGSSTSGSITSDSSNFTIGRLANTDADYFKGEIEEVRVFNKALTALELQRIVYQELDDANNFDSGKIIPYDVSTSFGTSLLKYYKMDIYTDDIVDDKKTAAIDLAGAKLYNFKDIYLQTAPLPYETVTNGDWSQAVTWLHGNVWDIKDGEKDWSIVHVKNNVTTSNSHKSVGLLVDANSELEINNDAELQNSWYLKLDGSIDLVGESQLIQTATSTLVTGSNGKLERDQQGTENLYTYNYWSSPVHSSNPDTAVDGNETYNVASVLFDGTDVLNPTAINFVGGYDGSNLSTPINIANYWIYKFDNRIDEYSEWQHVSSTGTLKVGEGYTMKGPGFGAISNDQNYVFTGKPNNGDIFLHVNAGNTYFIGNPYPSAIDAVEFLNDNPHLNGTLSFWEHYGGGSHYLAEYQGGYGLYNFSGGTPALSGTIATPDPDVSQSGTATKAPKRYIPVGQGFFVTATTTGDIKFENDQRIFITEANGTNSLFIKNTKQSKQIASSLKDSRPKFRLNYKSPKGYTRQLLTTIDDKASISHDWGFDAPLIENNTEDIYWNVEGENYIIQGINTPTEDTTLPLSVKTQNGGIIEINIDSLENVSDDFNLYLKDNDVYHNLKTSSYTTTVDAGVINDRFEIVFMKETLLDTDDTIENLFKMYYNAATSSIIINNSKNLQIQKLTATNMLGQKIFETDLNTSKKDITLPVNLITGAYLLTVKSTEDFTKKIMITK